MNIRRLITFVAFLSLFICTTAHAVRNDILVIVNDNSVDSSNVGTYYAEKRGVNLNNIVHVKTPASHFVTWDQFRSLRDQIIKHMQTYTLDAAAGAPAVCNVATPGSFADTKYYCQSSVEQLLNFSTIRYIVTTRGVPTAITRVPGSQLESPNGVTSVDNYLRFWLINYFTIDAGFSSLKRSASFGDGRGMRTVIPATDKELIVGRVDGVTYETSIALVDRAISAENNGIYGALFSAGPFKPSNIGPVRWKNYATSKLVYPPSGSLNDAWRYQFGLWGESRPECTAYGSAGNYLSFRVDANATDDNAPTQCRVTISEMLGNEPIPGTPRSRAALYNGKPLAVDALVYIGNQDGQAIGYGGLYAQPKNFDYATNWRRSADTQCSAYCLDDACRQASTDPAKEINTACVGVAEGFIGYNLQSFPAAGMFIWPTGWHGPNSGAANAYLAFPEVRTDIGYTDARSLWFRNMDQIQTPQCFIDESAEGNVSACADVRRLRVYQTWPLAAAPANGTTYRIRLKARGDNLNTNINLRISLSADPTSVSGGFGSVSSVGTLISLSSGTSADWIGGENDLVVTQLTSGVTYAKYLRLKIESSSVFTGSIGVDDLEILEIDPVTLLPGTNVAKNASLAEGFRQPSGGDFPSMFLSRMNGTALWGSISHHGSGGTSFADSMMERLIYWARGLPLGDAVWFGEGGRQKNSGVLYGDPLYSPIAVKFNYPQGDGTFIRTVTLSGDTINGKDTTKVSTTYAVDYCLGDDFYICDQQNLWQPTGLSGSGGQYNQPFGVWDAILLANGSYVMRLKVTSNNLASNKTQSFFDYLTITKRDAVISGTINDDTGQPLAGVNVAINNNLGFTSNLVTDKNGDYAGPVPQNGLYLVYASKSGHTLQTVSGNVFQFVISQDVENKDFIAVASNYFISGIILDQNKLPLANVPVAVNDNDDFTSSSITNLNGYYTQGGLSNGTYLISPSLTGYTFAATSGGAFETIADANVPNKDFIGSKPCCSISGSVVTDTGLPIAGASVSINNNSGNIGNTLADSNGNYIWYGLDNGVYLVGSSFTGCSFVSFLVAINDSDVVDKNFTGTCN